jgi:nitroreductase
MRPQIDLFEAIGTLRAVRRFTDEPVSDEELWTIIEAATMAPSGGNRQPWNFIVIRDPDTKRRIADYYRQAWEATYGKLEAPPPGSRPSGAGPQGLGPAYRSAEHLAHHLADTPVLIMVTTQGAGFGTSVTGSSIFPAVQNLMLAARALGLGTTITTLHRLHEAEVKKLLDIPDDIETMALIPVGRPSERFGPPRRLPVGEVTFWEKWGVRQSRGQDIEDGPKEG